MVEQEAVNFEVAGSSPASGAKQIVPTFVGAFCLRSAKQNIEPQVRSSVTTPCFSGRLD